MVNIAAIMYEVCVRRWLCPWLVDSGLSPTEIEPRGQALGERHVPAGDTGEGPGEFRWTASVGVVEAQDSAEARRGIVSFQLGMQLKQNPPEDGSPW
jgi:hypothetical protein